MVIASPAPLRNETILSLDVPIIDLSSERSTVSKLIVRASEEFGFFKVINHGVSDDTISKMEEESFNFFSKSVAEKQLAGPANPFGYGYKNIGFNGDMGEVEYLLLRTNPFCISQKSKFISNDPAKFSSAVNGYLEAVRDLACEILDLMAEGLWVQDRSYFSRMIRAVDNDSCFRLNHYPPVNTKDSSASYNRIGFGEHSDPQILTVLRSNCVDGLQISLDPGVWIPVSPDPAAFCVNVGDLLQALTNGKFVSVRHRALSNPGKSRMSMAYFGAPALNAWVSCPPEMVTESSNPSLYRTFTWAEYKTAAYSLRLGDTRLHLFRNCRDDHDHNGQQVA